MADSDISKMKVADLKRELKNRGKSTVGNKTELTERLQSALIEGDNTLDESVLNDDILDDDELNDELDDDVTHDIDSNHEDAVLKTPPDSIKSKSPELTVASSSDVNTQKKVVLKRKLNISVPPDNAPTNETPTTVTLAKSRKISITSPSLSDKSLGISSLTTADPTDADTTTTENKKVIVKLSELSAKERLELRAKKFGAPIAVESLKLARSERFGLTTKAEEKTESNSSSSSIKNGNNPVSVDILKKRAERFGGSVSKVMNKIENLEKLQKRSERFGKATTADDNKKTISGGSITSEQMAEKARLRLERFKTTVAS